MAKLYELVGDYAELVELEGQVDEEQLELIKNAVKEEIKSKSGNIIKVVRNLETDVTAIDEEIKRLQKMKKTKKNVIENIKNYTKTCLIDMGSNKIETPIGKITLRTNAPSVVVLDESLIPEDYMVVETTAKPDKNLIKELIKNGSKVPGCTLERSQSVTIK